MGANVASDVLVTGTAVCSPAGEGVAATLAALLAGRRAEADAPDFVPSFEGLPIRRREANRLTRADALGVAAAGRAALEAGLGDDEALAADAALFVGTSKDLGSYDDFLDLLPDLPAGATESESLAAIVDRATGVMSPFFLLDCMPNLALHYVATMFGIRGENSCFTGLGCAGAEALAQLAATVARGDARLGVALGFDRMLDPLNQTRLLAQWPAGPAGADAPVFTGGAGAIVLEQADHARARGARVRGRLLGVGAASDARAEGPDGPAGAVRAAIAAALAGAAPLHGGELAFVVAAGDSADGLTEVVGASLQRADVPVVAWGGALGQLLSATAPVAVALALEGLERGAISSGDGTPLAVPGAAAMVVSLGLRGQAHAFILARKDQ
jgi:3-oxoacyl-[acyl-carrier-protein] synthase II